MTTHINNFLETNILTKRIYYVDLITYIYITTFCFIKMNNRIIENIKQNCNLDMFQKLVN